MKSVSKDEFDEFIKAYPNKLHKQVHSIPEPPLISYYDFTLGNWPEGRVASCQVDYYNYPEIDPKSYKIKE